MPCSFIWVSSVALALLTAFTSLAATKPNVLLIVCDDLNDYIEGFGGHPQVQTPHIAKLAESGVRFTQAHCTIPICNPSRASLVSGLYPHTTQLFGFDHWDQNEVLKNSRTIMAHFRANGYHVLGTGKIMHNRGRKEWSEFGHPSDYGPFPFDGTKELAHPDVPAPFRDDFGPIDGSFGPLRTMGNGLSWRVGGWGKKRPMRYASDDDRDPTGDELNASWAVEKLKAYAEEEGGKPFFMGVGFVRPHTPLIVPQKYFDRFPLESIKLPDIKVGDAGDTFIETISEEDTRGKKIYDSLVASHGGDRELALKRFVQAYLASVASIDDLVGEIMAVIDSSPLEDNTIVVFTSDHGWSNGEKGKVYKNTLWQESTRVPLIIRAPAISTAGGENTLPVTLVDLYPTLIDLCGLPSDTMKNDKGRPLDGHTLRPLLAAPTDGTWEGPGAALTALYKWAKYHDPAKQSYSLRYKDWRYIRYENGKEELYRTTDDYHEWTNLALNPEYAAKLEACRAELLARIPKSIPEPVKDADHWKTDYFKRNPKADTNGDGELSWPEFKAAKEADKAKEPVKDAEYWKSLYFNRNPKADTDGDGVLSWPEFKAAKAKEKK
jgi:iduronate 2-sulfatase